VKLLSMRRAGLLALVLVACGNSKESAPTPAPEKVDEAKPVEAKPVETKPEAKAEPKAEAKPEEKAEAKADVKPEEKAEDKAKAEAPKEDAKKAAAAPAGKSVVPNPASGILGKGQADKIVKAGARPVVHLLDAGAEPRAAVSYALTKGAAKPFKMGMQLEMAIKSGGFTLPRTKVPRMGMLFELTVDDKQGSDWPVAGKLAKITVEPKGDVEEQIAKGLREQLDPMSGFAMNYFVDAKGRIRDVKLSWPEKMPPQAQQMMGGLSQSIESMMAPLPEEEIGTGAQWEVVGRLASAGADLLQVSTFKLKARKGDVLELDISVRQLAANEKVTPPGMPAGAAAKLISFKAGGTGTSVVDTTDIAPVGGSMTIKNAMAIEVSMDVPGQGSGADQTTVDTTVTVTYERPKS